MNIYKIYYFNNNNIIIVNYFLQLLPQRSAARITKLIYISITKNYISYDLIQ